MIRLNVGSGGKSEDPNYIGVDAFVEADVQALMWDLPYKDASVDEILSVHSLEHISKYDVIPTLREWKRVLKVGGKLDIVTPDLEWSLLWWLYHQSVGWELDIIFGNQEHEGQFHKTGFTIDIMRLYLDVVGGLIIVGIDLLGDDLAVTATCPPQVAQRVLDFKILRVPDEEKPPGEPQASPYDTRLLVPIKASVYE